MSQRKVRGPRCIHDLARPVDCREDEWVPDCAALHQIDRSAEQAGKGVCQAKKLFQRRQAAGVEINQKVSIAGGLIEVRSPGGRAEYFQLPHAVAAAQKGDFGAALVYQRVHDTSVSGLARPAGHCSKRHRAGRC